MSLAQLVSHFNQQFHQAKWSSGQAPFALEEETVVASFYGMRLESRFEPLLDDYGQALGHQALLQAFSPRGNPISPTAPYAVALDADSIVYLDRLVRTLHVLNATALRLTGLLGLEIHPWHITQVPDNHGVVFEGILRGCGWSPRDVILEIHEGLVQDAGHLARAIASFQGCGFAIALSQHSANASERERLLALQPDFLKLGRSHLLAAEVSADAERALAAQIQHIKQQRVRVLLHGVTTEDHARIACRVGADGYQDSIPHPLERTTIILVPGLGDSGPGHWQTLWARDNPAYRRVRQRNWIQPQVEEWIDALDLEIRRASSPVILIGHSLGCTTIVEWAQRCWADIRGALLVAPADTDRRPFFNTVPLLPLPFTSILVASADDPHLDIERATLFARHWGSRLVNIGRAGHINVESGFGPWPDGQALLAELRAAASAPKPRSAVAASGH